MSGRRAKIVAPLAVLAVAAGITAAMFALHSPAPTERPEPPVPLVEVVRVEPEAVRLEVSAQGTVEPRTESDLVAEVPGQIVWASPALASGGFFEKGETLVRIDARDYEVALEGARAALRRAESQLELAASTLARQRSMRERGISSQARLDEARAAHANAEASVGEARVAVRRAELDLERTRIRAPFDGRVREKHVDLGQFVNRGAPVARVYSVDVAEVRLPVRDADLAHLDVPAGFNGGNAGPPVTLTAVVAGEPRTWRGRIVRSEGARDPRTRMLNLVAAVDDPYVRDGNGDGAGPGEADAAERAPLPIGIFVEATIEGRRVEGVFEVPRTALRRDDRVFVVDDAGTLRLRPVEILRADRDRVWLRAGLDAGDRVVVSPLDLATEGMAVRMRDADEAAAPDATPAAAPGASS